MTPLGRRIGARIATTGPMTLADYMAECLLDPEHGYYTTGDPLGRDFVTSPEISQMFGELLGLWTAQVWLDQGSPAPFVLAELGPGRGTLMADALRATRGVPGFHAAMRLVLVEASPSLRARQREALRGHPVAWAGKVGALPEGPLFVLANEFFDALPIRQFRRTGTGWDEVVVTLVEGTLAFALAPAPPLDALAARLGDTRPGDRVELCAAGEAVAAAIGARIARDGGAALFIDYGGWHSLGDTFQAMKAHAFVDPLAEPGEADLTAHVDFEALANAAHPARARLVTQGALLDALGIGARAARLARGLAGEALRAHEDATGRLTQADRMGSLFRALALTPHGAPVPPGFDR